MLIPFLISKISGATVTKTDINAPGNVSIAADIMAEAGLREFQKVEISNLSNGKRFSTYVVASGETSGEIALNGTAARQAETGDKVLISAFVLLDERELNSLNATILHLKEKNEVDKVVNGRI